MKSKILPLCLLSLSLVSCKAIKEIQQVPGATLKMGDTTNQLKAGTERVEGISGDLRNISEQLKELSKAGIGSQMRDKAFDDMQSSESMSKKFVHATKYMESFDFQLWGKSSDAKIPDHILSEVYGKHAVIEFAMTLPEQLGTNRPKLSALQKSNDMQGFYAMASTLHKVNMFQEIFRVNQGMNEQTLLDYIMAALRKKDDIKKKKIKRSELSETDKEVLKYSPILIHTLKIRYKFLPLIALGKISHINDGLLNKIKMLVTKWEPEFDGDVELEEEDDSLEILEEIIDNKKDEKKAKKEPKYSDLVDSSDPEQIHYAAEILKVAMETRDFLESIGEPVGLDKKIKRIFKNLEVNTTDIKGEKGKTQVSSEQQMEIQNFNAKLNLLLKRDSK